MNLTEIGTINYHVYNHGVHRTGCWHDVSNHTWCMHPYAKSERAKNISTSPQCSHTWCARSNNLSLTIKNENQGRLIFIMLMIDLSPVITPKKDKHRLKQRWLVMHGSLFWILHKGFGKCLHMAIMLHQWMQAICSMDHLEDAKLDCLYSGLVALLEPHITHN